MTSFLLAVSALVAAGDTAATVLTQIGRDGTQTRLYSAALADLEGTGSQSMVVGGFTNQGGSDLSDIHVYNWHDGRAKLQWRVTWGSDGHSMLRSLRAADLDGDGRDEVVVLGSVGDRDNHRRAEREQPASAQLKVFAVRQGSFQAVDEVSWQDGAYTYGYGLAVADLDEDGLPEITGGGFSGRDETEQAELRVWNLRDDKLQLVASTHWGAKGATRVNGIAAGDLDGDGRVEIVTAGRTGQRRDRFDVTRGELGQLMAWRLEEGKLVRVASREWEDGGFARLRELKLADVDGNGTAEVIAVGRVEAQGRPYLGIYQLSGSAFRLQSEPQLPGDRLGEIRDVVFYGSGPNLRVVTIGSRGARPHRQGQLQVWSIAGGKLELLEDRLSAMGDETRVRDLVLWPDGDSVQLVTVGFVRQGRQHLGQILDWGAAPLVDR